MKTSEVSIIDSNGNLIASAKEGDPAINDANDNEGMRQTYQNRINSELKSLLESTIGMGKVRLQTNVEMDFDQISTNMETFDPEKTAVRSSQTVSDESQSANGQKTVSVANNLPDQKSGGDNGTANDLTKRTEETVNYEISKQVTNKVRQSGIVRKLSVAVVVDGTYKTNDKGERIYTPRTAEEIANLTTIVKSAVGYDESRGDHIEVINMQFLSSKNDEIAGDASILDKIDINSYAKVIETLVLAFIGLLVIFLVIRPLMQKVLESVPEITGGETSAQLLAAAGILPAIEAPNGKAIGTRPEESNEMINIDSIQGQIRTSSIKRVGEIIEQHPEEALNIIRSWLYEGQ